MRPALSLGVFGIFGRSAPLKTLDADLRALDLHPRLVPEAVKLAALRVLMEPAGGTAPSPAHSREAAELLAYCMVGAEGFCAANGEDLVQAVERRIEIALEEGTNVDAKLILLALHANVIQPGVVEQFRLEADTS